MNLEWDELPALFPGFASPERWLPLLRRHWDMVEGAAPRVRVTSVGANDAVRRHYAESLELLFIADAAGWTGCAVDVGSGGGFPGLVAACVMPDVKVALVEPLQKRARLLQEWADALGLANVTVKALRAEQAGRGEHREAAGLVTARAVAELRVLMEYTAPLATVGGLLALPKGSGLGEEEAAAGCALDELGLERLPTARMRNEVSEAVSVALYRKVAATNSRFPRRAGVPERRPL